MFCFDRFHLVNKLPDHNDDDDFSITDLYESNANSVSSGSSSVVSLDAKKIRLEEELWDEAVVSNGAGNVAHLSSKQFSSSQIQGLTVSKIENSGSRGNVPSSP